MDTHDVITEIKHVLDIQLIDYDTRDKFLLLCSLGEQGQETFLQWEMEVLQWDENLQPVPNPQANISIKPSVTSN